MIRQSGLVISPRDGEHLLLAAGERLRALAAPLLQPREELVDALQASSPPRGFATFRFSSTVSDANTRRPWGTRPMPRRTVSK